MQFRVLKEDERVYGRQLYIEILTLQILQHSLYHQFTVGVPQCMYVMDEGVYSLTTEPRSVFPAVCRCQGTVHTGRGGVNGIPHHLKECRTSESNVRDDVFMVDRDLRREGMKHAWIIARSSTATYNKYLSDPEYIYTVKRHCHHLRVKVPLRSKNWVNEAPHLLVF